MARKHKAATIGVPEFNRLLPGSEQAVKYFESVRWSNGPVCYRGLHAGEFGGLCDLFS